MRLPGLDGQSEPTASTSGRLSEDPTAIHAALCVRRGRVLLTRPKRQIAALLPSHSAASTAKGRNVRRLSMLSASYIETRNTSAEVLMTVPPLVPCSGFRVMLRMSTFLVFVAGPYREGFFICNAPALAEASAECRPGRRAEDEEVATSALPVCSGRMHYPCVLFISKCTQAGHTTCGMQVSAKQDDFMSIYCSVQLR